MSPLGQCMPSGEFSMIGRNSFYAFMDTEVFGYQEVLFLLLLLRRLCGGVIAMMVRFGSLFDCDHFARLVIQFASFLKNSASSPQNPNWNCNFATESGVKQVMELRTTDARSNKWGCG